MTHDHTAPGTGHDDPAPREHDRDRDDPLHELSLPHTRAEQDAILDDTDGDVGTGGT
jgi:hypothetical protein